MSRDAFARASGWMVKPRSAAASSAAMSSVRVRRSPGQLVVEVEVRGTLAEEAGAVELVVEDGAVEEGEVDRRAGVVGDHRHGAQQQVLDRGVAVADDGDVGEVEQVGVRLHVGMEVEVGHEVVRLEERQNSGAWSSPSHRAKKSLDRTSSRFLSQSRPVGMTRMRRCGGPWGAKSRSWRDRPVTTTRRAGQRSPARSSRAPAPS